MKPIDNYSTSSLSRSLSKDQQAKLDEMMKDKTVNELRAINAYISDACYKLEDTLHSECKMEDFENAKKESSDKIPTTDEY